MVPIRHGQRLNHEKTTTAHRGIGHDLRSVAVARRSVFKHRTRAKTRPESNTLLTSSLPAALSPPLAIFMQARAKLRGISISSRRGPECAAWHPFLDPDPDSPDPDFLLESCRQ